MHRTGILKTIVVAIEVIEIAGLLIVLFGGALLWPADLITFFWPYLLLPAAAILVLALFVPGWQAKVAAMAGVLLVAVPMMQLPEAPALSTHRSLRLIAANLYIENPDPSGFLAVLSETRPDVVVTEETRANVAEAIRATKEFPYESSSDLRAANDIKVFSRFPIASEQLVGASAAERHAIRLELKLPGGPLVVYAVHPATPRSPPEWRARNRYLSALATSIDSPPAGIPVVAAGDWNTPPWSDYFAGFFGQTGLRYARSDWGPLPTRFSLRMGGITSFGSPIDHVAVSSNVKLVHWQRGPKFGSNHLPVLVDLEISG